MVYELVSQVHDISGVEENPVPKLMERVGDYIFSLAKNDLTPQTTFLDARVAEMNLQNLVIDSGTFDPMSCSLISSFEQEESNSNLI